MSTFVRMSTVCGLAAQEYRAPMVRQMSANDGPLAPREVADLRRSVHRLDALVTQLERAIEVPDCAVADATLQRENERLRAALRLHPPPRPVMLPHRRLRLAAAQGWRCQICGELLPESFHADHIVPFANCYDDSDANIQIICAAPCHLEKTSHEQHERASRRAPVA